MATLATMTDRQLERRIAKVNRRAKRQKLQKALYRYFEGRTTWGKMATVGSLRGGAKLVARRISSAGQLDAALVTMRSAGLAA